MEDTIKLNEHLANLKIMAGIDKIYGTQEHGHYSKDT